MEYEFNNKINILKALAIIIMVSGHLGISIIPLFPTYSFHMAFFLFISGYLFKEKHLEKIGQYIKDKAKRLLIPCFWYTFTYLIITIIIYKFTGKFYGCAINIKNFLIAPLVLGSPLLLTSVLWFIPNLFISLSTYALIYKGLKKIWDNKYFHLAFFLILAVLAIPLSVFKTNSTMLIVIRALFSIFFIYLGFYYKTFIENKHDIFNYKWFGSIVILQSILWLFNTNHNSLESVANGLVYILAQGEFYNSILPILTSITGIWASLFIINLIYSYIKDNKFIDQIGKNTYHIMANHVFLIYLLSNFLLWINKIPISVRKEYNIFWVYAPEKTTYLYLIFALTFSTFIGIGINRLRNK